MKPRRFACAGAEAAAGAPAQLRTLQMAASATREPRKLGLEFNATGAGRKSGAGLAQSFAALSLSLPQLVFSATLAAYAIKTTPVSFAASKI